MERRTLLALPGLAALATGHALGEAKAQAASGVSNKTLAAHSGSKSAYKVPAKATKLTKYMNGLTALLSLTAGQQQEATAVFTTASSSRASIQSGLKSARKALKDAVKSNDTAAISQATASLSALTGQKISNGALAHAKFFQLLTPAQQTVMAQLRG
jgi:Spy/CpxP family protein refolding chaperone